MKARKNTISPILTTVMALALWAAARPVPAQPIFHDDFESGNVAAWSALVPGDAIDPILDITSPTGLTVSTTPEIAASFRDTLSGIDLASLSVVLDGDDILPSCTVDVASVTCTPRPLSEDEHQLVIVVADHADNEVMKELAFVVDSTGDQTPPTIIIDAPAMADTFEQTTPIAARYFDTGSDPALDSLSVRLDGDELIADCTVDLESVVCPEANVIVGAHNVTVSIEDESGNAGVALVSWNVLADATEPTLAILMPGNGARLFNQPRPRLLATYADAESGIDVGAITVRVDGQDVTSTCDITFDRADCRPALSFASHTVLFSVPDHAGNQASASQDFTLIEDEAGPLPTWISPLSGDVLEMPPALEIAFQDAETAVDLTSLRIDLDAADITAGCSVAATNASCPPAASLAEGVHHLSAQIADEAGNVSAAEIFFEIGTNDRAKPALDIVSPGAGTTVSGNASPTIEVAYSDDGDGVDLASLVVQIDDLELSAVCQAGPEMATCPTPALLPGTHQVLAQVFDLAGNFASTTATFTLQTQLTIAITSPSPGFVTRADTVDITGTVDPAATTVDLEAMTGILGGGTFDLPAVPLVEGSNTLTVVARDGEGALGTATVTVVRDTEAPRVAIVTPADGLVTSSPQIAITGEVRDLVSSNVEANAPQVTINGIPAVIEQRAFMVSDFLLQPGENHIRAVAVDAAGNEGSFEIRVDFVPEAAVKVEEMLGNGQSGTVGQPVDQPLIVRVTDALGRPLAGRAVDFQVSRGDGQVSNPPREGRTISTLTDELGFAQARFTLGNRSGAGNHEVTVSTAGVPGVVIFCLHAQPGPAQRIKRVRGDNQLGAEAGLAGAQLPKPLLAQVFDSLGNPAAGVDVTFQIVAGGGRFANGLPAHVATTDADGQASATLVLGDSPGTNNNIVEAFFPELSETPARFELSARASAPESATSLSGIVLDNNDQPVPGVTLSLRGTARTAVAATDGTFQFPSVETGTLHLDVDGSTTTRLGDWPSLSYELIALPGQSNDLGKPLRLLPIDTAGGAIAGGDSEVTIPLAGVPGAELTVFPNSVTFPDGSHEGLLSFTQVHTDKVPMEPPQGTDFMLAWTVQPTGTLFDPPARISIPNSDLLPGAIVDIFSFDHDLGEFLPVGTASVTEDGSQLVSNPGFGVVKAGWHGCLPPPPPTGGACSPSSCTICPPGGGPPEPKCGDCSVCEDGTCNPESVDDLSCEANGIKDEDGPVIVGADQDVNFRAIEEGDCSNPTFEWDFGDGSDPEEGSSASHAYEEPGDYTAVLVARCDCESSQPGSNPESRNSMSVSMLIKVLEVDLQIQDLPEEDMSSPNEEDPGAWIALNNDDDNENGEPDLEDDAGGMDEDDLVELNLMLADDLERGEVKLEATRGGNRIKAWEEAEKMTEIDLPKTWDDVAEAPEMVWIEGVEDSSSTSDVEITLTYTPISFFGRRGDPIEDKVKATVVSIDVDVDSDNDQGFDLPTGSDDEDKMEDFEDDAEEMGKIVIVNNNNDDWETDLPEPPASPTPAASPALRDLFTDFADGYDHDGMPDTGDEINLEEQFVPLVIELGAGVDVSLARLRFQYDASDPAGITTATPVPGLPEFIEYRRPAGTFRIWTKKGEEMRDATPVGMGGSSGDYVVADPTWFFASELDFSSGDRKKTFYIEAIRPSSSMQGDRISVELDPDGEGDLDFFVVDTVRVTSTEIVLFDGAEQVHGAEVAWIDAEPTAAMPRMPPLSAKTDPGLPILAVGRWRMESKFNRDADLGGTREDRVQVPTSGGWFSQGPEDSWDIAADYPANPDPMDPGDTLFFGGETFLHAQFGSVGGVGFETELQFRILGRNPEDAQARAHIDANDSHGGQEFPYAYAIARHESRDGNRFYNQFEPRMTNLCFRRAPMPPHACLERRRFLTGHPKKGPPDGWGMFQRDVPGAGTSATVQQLWNWHANRREGLRVLGVEKRPVAVNHLARERIDAGGVAPPDRAADTCNLSDTHAAANDCGRFPVGMGLDCNYTDAIAIKFYNGASRPVPGSARSRACTAPMNEALDPMAVHGHFLAWDDRATCGAVPMCNDTTPNTAMCMPARPTHSCGGAEHWDFSWRNIDCTNYLNEICEQIGPP